MVSDKNLNIFNVSTTLVELLHLSFIAFWLAYVSKGMGQILAIRPDITDFSFLDLCKALFVGLVGRTKK